MPTLIQIKDLTKKFGDNTVLDNINLEIPEGKIFGIIGINGSGKTTLLRILIGFYNIDKGKIIFKNKDVTKNIGEVRKIFGFATQNNCFYDKLSVKENLEYFGSLYGLSENIIQENISRILPLVELEQEKDKLAEKLSTGMQRRLDLACSLVHYPKVLILDEPTEDLDPPLRREMISLIKKLNKIGTTIIITSHLLEEIEHLCDKIAIIHKSKIVKIGNVDELRGNKTEEIHLETAPGNYKKLVDDIKGCAKHVVNEGDKIVIYTPEAEKILHRILLIIKNNKEKIIYLDIKKPSLDEIFEGLVKEK